MVKEYELINVEINKLKFDSSNPNRLTDAEMKAVHKSMEKFGYLTPIIIDQNYNIADGEHRVYCYKEYGHTSIPAYIVPCKTDADRRLIRQTLNKLRGKHSRELDIEEFRYLIEAGLKEDLLALIPNDKELELYLAKDIKEDEFDIREVLNKPKYDVKLGDLWQLGNHRLLCGDATKQEDVSKLMGGVKANMVFTDPPYGVDYASKNVFLNTVALRHRIEKDILGDTKDTNIGTLWREAFQNVKNNIKEGASFYITFSGDKLLLLQTLTDINF